MAGRGFAPSYRCDPAEEIHVPPGQVLDLNTATRGRNGENCRAMRHHPFRPKRNPPDLTEAVENNNEKGGARAPAPLCSTTGPSVSRIGCRAEQVAEDCRDLPKTAEDCRILS